MLVYARRRDKQPDPEAPSLEALEAVTAVNEAHGAKTARYIEKYDNLNAECDDRRAKMLDVFKTWNLTDARQVRLRADAFSEATQRSPFSLR